MKNILKKIKINPATYFIIISFLFTGLIKNIILIYLIIIVHELGHILIIKLLKYKLIKIEIYPMGGVTTVDKLINTPLNKELLLASFGIIFQLLLGLIFYLFLKFNLINHYTYNLFWIYNKTIIIFNLLPITPLDGFIIMHSLCEKFFSYHLSFYISLIISILSLIFFISYNTIYSLNNYLIISFLIFKLIFFIRDFKYSRLRFELERYLYNLPFNKLKYNSKLDLKLLKKDTYHYFKNNNTYISEQKVLFNKYKSLF